ncbi:unnamed protein product [Ixodes hexagonus]
MPNFPRPPPISKIKLMTLHRNVCGASLKYFEEETNSWGDGGLNSQKGRETRKVRFFYGTLEYVCLKSDGIWIAM